MEQFDIEKLKRNTPYELPKNTFEAVQRNVLAEIVNKKKAPIIKLNWAYAAAAVLLLLFGLTFMFNSSANETPNTVIVNNELPSKTIRDNVNFEGSSPDANYVENSNEVYYGNTDADLTSEPIANLNTKRVSQKGQNISTIKNVKMVTKPIDEKVDDVLDGFTATDLALLTVNTEQDVYLDLYN